MCGTPCRVLLPTPFLLHVSAVWPPPYCRTGRSIAPSLSERLHQVKMYSTIMRQLGVDSVTARPDPVPSEPRYIEDPTVAGGQRINPAAFVVPTEERQGLLGRRNALRGFGLAQVDFGARSAQEALPLLGWHHKRGWIDALASRNRRILDVAEAPKDMDGTRWRRPRDIRLRKVLSSRVLLTSSSF